MATTAVADALVFPQSQGTGLASEDQPNSAVSFSLLADYVGGEYVRQDYADGMGFVSRDGTNDTLTIGAGACFITDTSASTGGQRSAAGNPRAQSTASSGYDTESPGNTTYLVVFPTPVTVAATGGTANQVWVNITDVTANNAVEVRTDGGGGTTSAPTDTYLKLGEADPDGSVGDTRSNDRPAVTLRGLTLAESGADPDTAGDVQANGGDIKAYSGGAVRNLSNIGSGSSGSLTSLATTTVTADSGSQPAFTGTIENVATAETQRIVSVAVTPDTADQTTSDYAYNIDWFRQWDESAQAVDVELTVNWDIDPGNNMTLAVEVFGP